MNPQTSEPSDYWVDTGEHRLIICLHWVLLNWLCVCVHLLRRVMCRVDRRGSAGSSAPADSDFGSVPRPKVTPRCSQRHRPTRNATCSTYLPNSRYCSCWVCCPADQAVAMV